MSQDLKRLLPWLLIPLFVAGLAFLEPGLFFGSSMVDQPAPSFSLPLVAGEGVGDVVSLEAERGHVVVLDFWASWCGPCRQSIPILNRLHDRTSDQGVRFYGVNVEAVRDLPPRQLVLAHASFGARFPTVRDDAQQLQRSYGVNRFPTIVVIDKQGRIRHAQSGVPSPTRLLDAIREAAR